MDSHAARILDACSRWKANGDPKCAAAELVLLHLALRHGSQWMSGPRDRSSHKGTAGSLGKQLDQLGMELPAHRRQQIAHFADYRQLWRGYFFRGVALDSHEGQLAWMEERYPLEVRFDIPKPKEMLDIQCERRRYITLLLEPGQQFAKYGRHDGACAFLLHDFEHAHKFFADPESHQGQVCFFRSLRTALPNLERWRADERFCHDLDYLMSDMNSHPVHLTKYLKAIVLAAEIRQSGDLRPELDGFFHALFAAWGMSGRALEAALHLNQPAKESSAGQREVAEFFIPLESACAPPLSAGR